MVTQCNFCTNRHSFTKFKVRNGFSRRLQLLCPVIGKSPQQQHRLIYILNRFLIEIATILVRRGTIMTFGYWNSLRLPLPWYCTIHPWLHFKLLTCRQSQHWFSCQNELFASSAHLLCRRFSSAFHSAVEMCMEASFLIVPP